MSTLALVGSGAPVPPNGTLAAAKLQLQVEDALASVRRLWIRGQVRILIPPQDSSTPKDSPSTKRRWWSRWKKNGHPNGQVPAGALPEKVHLEARISGATWETGSYDPETQTLYWAVGNPYPDTDPSERGGTNLYTNSVVALEAKTGRFKWSYQFTPYDTHDWDATEPNVLVNTKFRGLDRKLLLHADRNGFFYVFDRTDGQLLLTQKLIRRLTWASGIGPDGRPLLLPETDVTCPEDATNWNATAFSPVTRLYYITSWSLKSVRSNSRPAVGRVSVRGRNPGRSICVRSILRQGSSFGKFRNSDQPTARGWRECWQRPREYCSMETQAGNLWPWTIRMGKRCGTYR